MPFTLLRLVLPLALLASAGHPAFTAQDPSGAPSTPQFQTTTELVEVYVTAVDERGRPVRDLRREEFTLLDNGVPQPFSAFASGDIALTLALAIDRSFSMGAQRLALAKAGAQRLIRALQPHEQLLVLAIGGTVDVVAPLGPPSETALDAVLRLDLWGTSPIGDSLAAALDTIGEGRGRRALVLLSDGEERESRQEAEQLLDRIRRSDVLVYPVTVGRGAPSLMTTLAAVSGGRLVQGRDRQAVDRGMAGIIEELRSQYFLGYSPPPDRAPGWHRLEIRTSRPGVRLRARQGYVVP